MVNLGLAEFLEGDLAAATRSLRQSLVAADRIGDTQGVACAVIGLALCASTAGDLTRAVSLYGTADALCQENDLPLEPLEERLADEDRRRLRGQLEGHEYDQALEAGRRLPSADRLGYALA